MGQKNYVPDNLDVSIIQALSADGRISFRSIADNLGISDQTVRFRVARLIENCILRVAPLMNPFCFDNSLLSLVGMQLENRTQKKTMDEIAKLPNVVSVCNTAGEFDLIVEVYHRSRRDLNHFLFEELPAVEGIKNTHSFVCLDATGKWIPTENITIPTRNGASFDSN